MGMCVNVFLLDQTIVEVRLSVGSQVVVHGASFICCVSEEQESNNTNIFVFMMYITAVPLTFKGDSVGDRLSLIHI